MTEPPLALSLATAFLDAWTANDLERAGSYLAEDFSFAGPIAHYSSAEEFLHGSQRFLDTINPGWNKIAAFGDRREALLLYDLVLRSGATLRIADHYTVDHGKLQTEAILWDTGRPL